MDGGRKRQSTASRPRGRECPRYLAFGRCVRRPSSAVHRPPSAVPNTRTPEHPTPTLAMPHLIPTKPDKLPAVPDLPDGARTGLCGLVLPETLSHEEWAAIAPRFRMIHSMTQ